MFYRLLKKINIDRALVFYALVFSILVLPLTYVNNHYYYKSIAGIEKNKISTLYSVLNSFSEMCVKTSNGNTAQCINEIKTLLENTESYYGKFVSITDKSNVVLLSYDERKYSDSRKPIKLSSIEETTRIPVLDATIEIIVNPIPNIWNSVFRSVTFSVGDAINKDKDWNFNVALGRSAPFLSFLFIVLLVVYLLKKSIIAQIELINEFESEEPRDIGPTY